MLLVDNAITLWVAVAIIAAIVEVSIPHFGLIFVSSGALTAALVAWIGFGPGVQLLVFCVEVILTFALLRPRLMARLGSRGVPSRTEALLNREGVVTVDIDPLVGAGRINVGGEDWAARSKTPIPAGRRIRVVAADGVVLEVVAA